MIWPIASALADEPISGAAGRLTDEAHQPITDAVVRYGPFNGVWVAQERPDADGRFRVPSGGARQTWFRVESPGHEVLTVGTVSYADLTLVLPATERCATAPTTDPWSSVTPPSWWATECGLPEVPGPHWIRLDVEGPLTFERMLVTFVERPDGSADVEVRGRGFGSGAQSERHAPLNAAVWLQLRSLIQAMVTATPAAFDLPPAGGACSVGSTRFRLESGSNGGASGVLRDGLVRDSREWDAIDRVLYAAGLSLDR